MTREVEPFHLAVPQVALDDLRARLAQTRWPERETVDDHNQCAPLADMRALCAYWRDSYDWRRCEATLNELGQYRTTIDGLGIQSTRPQTIGYALTDSPAGQAAWIFEKLVEWSDPQSYLSHDDMLDNIMLYWLTGTAASSARLYWESLKGFAAGPTDLPVACSIFPAEITRPARAWAARKYPNLIYWGEPDRGGHIAAFEQPELFVDEIRQGFRSIRADQT